MELGYLIASVGVLIVLLIATYKLSRKDDNHSHLNRIRRDVTLPRGEDGVIEKDDTDRPGGRLARRRADRDRQKEAKRQDQEARVETQNRRQHDESSRRTERDFHDDEAELIRTERLKLLEEEKRQQEEEEALLWCRTMSIEETGEEPVEPESNILQKFITDIKEEKVVFLEQLSLRYDLPVDRIVSTIEV